MGKITSEVLTGIFSASYTPCHQTHVALRSVTELYLAFYVYKCFLFMLKGGLLCTMCVREGTCFPFQLAVRAWENKISSFLLPLFHSTSSTHQLCMATCHWPLPTPIFFPSLRLHMYDHTTQHCIWGDCTKFCSTSHAEIYVALCRPGDQGGECAFIGVQFRHAAPDKTYHTCIRLQDHWVRNVRCGAWPEMASAKTCVV